MPDASGLASSHLASHYAPLQATRWTPDGKTTVASKTVMPVILVKRQILDSKKWSRGFGDGPAYGVSWLHFPSKTEKGPGSKQMPPFF